MTATSPFNIVQTLVPCQNLNRTIAWFQKTLGLRLEIIFPADDPTTAVMSGHGLTLRLERSDELTAPTIRLDAAKFGLKPTTLKAPGGTQVVLATNAPAELPMIRQSLVVRPSASSQWIAGRAGMQYRDLEPGRQGGRFIASHIRIPEGGPVPDYVHYHQVRFQMIYCHRGWVKVVYEDQGPPFVMRPGDCVLQPPEIRHRVIEASDGLEVIEISCPAEHPTLVEHSFDLPNSQIDENRLFGGQQFISHQADAATWHPACPRGFLVRDMGFAAATDCLASARVIRAARAGFRYTTTSSDEYHMFYVLAGTAIIVVDETMPHALFANDAVTLPGKVKVTLTANVAKTEILEVTLPA